LLEDYLHLTTRPLLEVSREELDKPDSPAIRAAVARRVEAFLAGLAHLEYLIRNRQVSARQAGMLFAGRVANRLREALFFPQLELRFQAASKLQLYQTVQAELELAVKGQRQFLTDVFPKVLTLSQEGVPKDGPPQPRFVEWWDSLLMGAALDRVDRLDRNYRTKDDLEFIYRVLTETSPDGVLGQDDHVTRFLGGMNFFRQRVLQPDDCSEQEWVDFLTRLTKSRHQVAQFYGRYGLLFYHWENWRRHRDAMPADTIDNLLVDADALLKDLAASGILADSRSKKAMCGKLADFGRMTARLTKTESAAKDSSPHGRQPPRPPGREMRSRHEADSEAPAIVGRLKYDEIPLKVATLSGKAMAPNGAQREPEKFSSSIDHWRQCGPALDVLWTRNAIFSLRQKDLAVEISSDAQANIQDVQWDGNRLWVGTRQAGIWMLSPDGKMLGKIGAAEGLPPTDWGVLLYPLEAGKICAVGSFGEHRRGWCAIVTADGAGKRVHIFHEATHLRDGKDYARSNDDPQLVFFPGWIHEYHGLPGSPRTLLVGRSSFSPLAIDLETLAVSVFPRGVRFESLFSRNGEILEATGYGVKHWAAPGKTWPNGKEWRYRWPPATGTLPYGGDLLPYEGWLYASGRWYRDHDTRDGWWYRMNMETFAEELLSAELRPEDQWLRFAVSAHYGLVAWTHDGLPGRKLSRVTVLDAPAAEQH
jgi:hypothetical protein